jgi:hypothetical protein
MAENPLARTRIALNCITLNSDVTDIIICCVEENQEMIDEKKSR